MTGRQRISLSWPLQIRMALPRQRTRNKWPRIEERLSHCMPNCEGHCCTPANMQCQAVKGLRWILHLATTQTPLHTDKSCKLCFSIPLPEGHEHSIIFQTCYPPVLLSSGDRCNVTTFGRWFGLEGFVTLAPNSFSGRIMDEQVFSSSDCFILVDQHAA